MQLLLTVLKLEVNRKYKEIVTLMEVCHGDIEENQSNRF